jgi:hypothetical protein
MPKTRRDFIIQREIKGEWITVREVGRPLPRRFLTPEYANAGIDRDRKRYHYRDDVEYRILKRVTKYEVVG